MDGMPISRARVRSCFTFRPSNVVLIGAVSMVMVGADASIAKVSRGSMISGSGAGWAVVAWKPASSLMIQHRPSKVRSRATIA